MQGRCTHCGGSLLVEYGQGRSLPEIVCLSCSRVHGLVLRPATRADLPAMRDDRGRNNARSLPTNWSEFAD